MLLAPVSTGVIDRLEGLGWRCSAPATEHEIRAALADAEACYGNLTPERLATAPRLRWLQANTAGLDNFWFPELRASTVHVTNVRGIYSDFIADHALAFILTFARGFHFYARRQQAHRWAYGAPVRHLDGATLLMVGLGGIGLAVAQRARAFGLNVIGVDPHPKGRPDWLAGVHAPDRLPTLLPSADYIVLATPHTPETDSLFNEALFACTKPDAILINVGRGRVVCLDALVSALQSGRLGGAGLDVFEQEPLPSDHPLWTMENVIITPHAADRTTICLDDRRAEILIENARRYRAGDPLINVVDKILGYVAT